MGWTLRSDDGTQAVLDMGDWGTAVFRQAAPGTFDAASANSRRGPVKALVTGFGFAIDKWNAKTVEQELKARGLSPVADHDGSGFESFHVTDPDGFDLQIGNGMGHAKARKSRDRRDTRPNQRRLPPQDGGPCGWITSRSTRLTTRRARRSTRTSSGGVETYDEGSQHELMIGEAGDIIIRGGNALVADGGRNSGRVRRAARSITSRSASRRGTPTT